MFPRIFVFSLFIGFLPFSSALFAQKQGFEPEKLHLSWQLLQAQYGEGRQHLAVLTLHNQQSRYTLPAQGWSLFFSSLRLPKEEVESGLWLIEHLQGDWIRLRPGAAFKALGPNGSAALRYVSYSAYPNRSDAPQGAYIVFDEAPDKAHNLPPIAILSPAEGAYRQAPEALTPEKIYDQNIQTEEVRLAELCPIFPTPRAFMTGRDSFVLDANIVLVSDQLFEKERDMLADRLTAIFGVRPIIRKNARERSIKLIYDAAQKDPEGYTLKVIPGRGIEIGAATAAGAFYGIQSLFQLFPLKAYQPGLQTALSLPEIAINDAPRFHYRGMMIDVARNFQEAGEIKRVLDWMALYKLNTLHLHLTDDEGWRIEIAGLPELTSVGAWRGHTGDGKRYLPPAYGSGGEVRGGFYTRAAYIELLQYAKSLHIEVIPEIETPGHARAAIRAMQYRYEQLLNTGNVAEAAAYMLADPQDSSSYLSAQLYTDNVMCVALPSVYRFIEKVLDDMIAMHNEAGMPLKTIHLGADEVPRGVWERSPLCRHLLSGLPAERYASIDDLWLYYWEKMRDILQKRGLYASGWEEIGMRPTSRDGRHTMIVNPVFANDNVHAYVWNTVIGWGSEDLPYRLANGGYKVVLCPVSNLYFDLACQKSFDEPGLYWGGFNDIDKPFQFIPFDYLKNANTNAAGQPVRPEAVQKGKDRLTEYGARNIVGMQGQLWSETLHSPEALEYMALPKMLGLAERAWAPDPAWVTAPAEEERAALYARAWGEFVSQIGKRQLPVLSWYKGGAAYRIPPVGAKMADGHLLANVQFPGLTIRYTTDGTIPGPDSPVYRRPVLVQGKVQLRAFDVRGRGSAVTTVNAE